MYQLSSTEPSIPCLQFSDGVLNGDKLFEQFIRGVNNAFENNNTFSVADMAGSHIFDEQPSCDRGQQLFIRPCYEKFLESVMALWFPNNQNFESVPVIVMGSGGTGKTTLKTILCKRIMEKINTTLSKNESQSIILQYGESQTYYHAHFRRTLEGSVIVQCTKETASGTYFVRNLPQQVYYLVETGAGDISKASQFQRIGKDHAVFFSRPSMSLTGGSLSTEDKAKTLCIPLWTLNELLQANYSLNLGIDSSELNERYKRFGGVARNVLECASSAAHNPHLSIPESSKESANIYAVFDIASIRFLGPELYNELILCRTALTSEGNYNFAGFTEEWASKRAALRVAGKFELLLSVQLHFETRTWKKNDGFSNKLSGYVFDVYPIHVLQTKGLSPFRIRSLKNTSAGVTIMRRLRRVTGMPQQSPQMTSRMRKWLGMQGPARRTVYVTGDAEMDAALHEDSAQAGDLIIPTAFDHPAVDAVLVFPHAEVAGPVADEDPSNNKPPHQQPQQYSDHHSQHKPRLHYLLVHNTQAHGGDILLYEGPANQRLRDLIAACGGVERCAVAFFLPPREFATFPLQFIPSTDVAQLRMTL